MRCPSSSLHPPFVLLGVNAVIPHCVGPQTRLRTAMEGYHINSILVSVNYSSNVTDIVNKTGEDEVGIVAARTWSQ